MENKPDEIDFTFYDRVKDTYDLRGRMGNTDYIDFLSQDEVPKNMMKGVDGYGRKFLTMKIGGIDLENNKFFRAGQVFFQRYTDTPNIVGACFSDYSLGRADSFIDTCGGTTPPQYQLINNLVDGKLVKIKKEHSFSSNNHNVIIANMDYWENKFAKIIQKQWDFCRYNLKYTVCKKILNEQYNEYSNGINVVK